MIIYNYSKILPIIPDYLNYIKNDSGLFGSPMTGIISFSINQASSAFSLVLTIPNT